MWISVQGENKKNIVNINQSFNQRIKSSLVLLDIMTFLEGYSTSYKNMP